MKSCESCLNYVYDEEEDFYECCISMDEDDYYRRLKGDCPFYQIDNEYIIVHKQI